LGKPQRKLLLTGDQIVRLGRDQAAWKDDRRVGDALNDARIRFALPAGISSISLIFLLRNAADWPRDDVPVAAAIAVSLLGLL